MDEFWNRLTNAPSKAGEPALVNGTWRLSRLTNVSGVVLVRIDVRALALVDDCHCACDMYKDFITLNAQETTPGDLSQVLFEVHCRSRDEHNDKQAKGRARAKLRDITRVNCLRADSRTRCRTCISWDGTSVLDPVPVRFFGKDTLPNLTLILPALINRRQYDAVV